MAGNAKRLSINQYMTVYCQMLSAAKDIIVKKIQSVLSPVKFNEAMETNSSYLSNELPPAAWTQLFNRKGLHSDFTQAKPEESTGENSKMVKDGMVTSPIEPESLSLYELIMLSHTLPPLSQRFSKEEKAAMQRLRDVVQDIHAEYILKSDDSDTIDESTSKRCESIESNLKAVLADIGVDCDHFEDKPCDTKIFSDSSGIFFEVIKKISNKMKCKGCEYSDVESAKIEKLIRKSKEAKKEPTITISQREALTNAIEQAVNCGYCQGIPKEPKTLPCLHVCCASCLKSRITDVSGASSGSGTDTRPICCPECSTKINLPSATHVDQLPRGFLAEALIRLHQLIAENSSLECRICLSEPGHICFVCCDFYCENHIANYYKQTNAEKEGETDHEDLITPISSLADVSVVSSWLYRFCPQHKQRISHFCSGCKVPLCAHMLCVDWHSQHADPVIGLRRIEEAIEEERQKVTELQHILCQKGEKVRAKIELVEKSEIMVADVQENIRQSIEKYFADIEDKVAKQKGAFLSDLDKAASQCFNNDEIIRSRLQLWREKTIKLDNMLQHHLDSHSPVPATDFKSLNASVPELVSLRYRMLQQISDACSGALVAVTKRLSYPETRLSELQRQIGALQSNIAAVPANRGWESVIKFPSGLGARAIGAPLHFVIDDQRQIAYVITGGKLMASCKVMSYDLKKIENRIPNEICDAGPGSFESLALDAAGRRLFVTEQMQSHLALSTLRVKKFLPIRIYGINNTRMVELLQTLSIDTPTRTTHIHAKWIIKYVGARLYVAQGMCISECDSADEFKLTRKFNFQNILEITDFAVDSERDFIYVVDAKKHSFLIFDCQRHSVKNVGEHGVTPGRFDQPSSVALDKFGHVFIADAGNFRVQVLDVDGNFLRLIQYPQLFKEANQKVAQNDTASPVKVCIQVADNCLYLIDSRSEQLWRFRYM